MDFKIIKMTTTWGEQIEIRETPSGETVCPVCGGVFPGDPPWDEYHACDDDGNPVGEPYGAASFDGCPCCGTHYGNDDHPWGNQTLKGNWERLRQQWLQRVDITPEIKKQLLNLEIVIT